MPSSPLDAFIARWSAASASERANSQPFLLELCDGRGLQFCLPNKVQTVSGQSAKVQTVFGQLSSDYFEVLRKAAGELVLDFLSMPGLIAMLVSIVGLYRFWPCARWLSVAGWFYML